MLRHKQARHAGSDLLGFIARGPFEGDGERVRRASLELGLAAHEFNRVRVASPLNDVVIERELVDDRAQILLCEQRLL